MIINNLYGKINKWSQSWLIPIIRIIILGIMLFMVENVFAQCNPELDAPPIVLSQNIAANRPNILLIIADDMGIDCLLYTSPSPRDRTRSRMPSSA